MKNLIVCLLIVVLLKTTGWSQRLYSTNKGLITFTTEAPAKSITGKNEKVKIDLNAERSVIFLTAKVNQFEFENNFVSDSLNQTIKERFLHYYLQSDQYPVIIYQGSITNSSELNFSKNGTYKLKTSGVLSVHGIECLIETEGTIKISDQSICVTTEWIMTPQMFHIRIPSYIGDMYFGEIGIHVSAKFTH